MMIKFGHEITIGKWNWPMALSARLCDCHGKVSYTLDTRPR